MNAIAIMRIFKIYERIKRHLLHIKTNIYCVEKKFLYTFFFYVIGSNHQEGLQLNVHRISSLYMLVTFM